MIIEKTEVEIEGLYDDAADREESKYPGMTYEDGIKAAIDWLTGNEDTYPM